jgi:hypothetical protein
MLRRVSLWAWVPLLLPVGLASAQESYPIMERVAQKVIEKYQKGASPDLPGKSQESNWLLAPVALLNNALQKMSMYHILWPTTLLVL